VNNRWLTAYCEARRSRKQFLVTLHSLHKDVDSRTEKGLRTALQTNTHVVKCTRSYVFCILFACCGRLLQSVLLAHRTIEIISDWFRSLQSSIMIRLTRCNLTISHHTDNGAVSYHVMRICRIAISVVANDWHYFSSRLIFTKNITGGP
jgi:hypothetical protein